MAADVSDRPPSISKDSRPPSSNADADDDYVENELAEYCELLELDEELDNGNYDDDTMNENVAYEKTDFDMKEFMRLWAIKYEIRHQALRPLLEAINANKCKAQLPKDLGCI